MKRGLTSVHKHRQLLIISATIRCRRGHLLLTWQNSNLVLIYLVLAPSTGWRELLNYYSLKSIDSEHRMFGRVSTNDFISYSVHVHKNIKANVQKRVEHYLL